MDQKQTFEGILPSTGNDLTGSTTLYHIYHTGPYTNYYSIHTESDSNTPLNQYPGPIPGTENQKKSAKKVRKARALDNPRCDPRTETSPYFLHLPTVYGKSPPYTLRQGGKKTAPTACLLHCSGWFKTWKIEFSDALALPGIIDGRGVVNMKYGTKKGIDGTFQGYEVRSKRYLGESGKAWHKLQADQDEKVEGLTEKLVPEEVVTLQWTAPFSSRTREYGFRWRGFEFVWKGTQTFKSSKKFFRPFLRYNNLKLVVFVPEQNGEKAKEVILARYASIAADRKSGRLEVYQHVIDRFLSEAAPTLQQYEPTASVVPSRIGHQEISVDGKDLISESSVRASQRLADVVMGTAMSMIIAEFTKRQILVGVILAIVGNFDG
ncbi:uncharacterized protein RCO7_06378 [Rhynchosporium graminicola]|uniref:Uncharacterized protein n=1 Tax=Rhynchosporium graminicola TaxID=2792576 RepID=A0A1E1KP13_9HELO|nr:uncharacterized protein RCO7_06378 [Rhynchosporium commune]